MKNYINLNSVLETLVGEITIDEMEALCREMLHIANIGGDLKDGMLKQHYQKIMIMQLELLRDLLTSPIDRSLKEMRAFVESKSMDDISDDEIREL